MSALFIGHGNPMNALPENPYPQRWAKIGATRAVQIAIVQPGARTARRPTKQL
jgi:aromatic ring-opening dioxygenase catalytic subunit (LigB family)